MKPKTSESTKFYVTKMEEYMQLPGSTIRTLERLWKYNFPEEVIKRLKKNFPFNSMTYKDVGICVDEFKKFIAIMVIGKKEKKGVAMTSNVIDEIWHEFVLFTLDYHAFSEMLDLQYIHHTPNTKSFSFGPSAAQFFFDTYRKYFGELHPIWYYTMEEEGLKNKINSYNYSAITALLHKTKLDNKIGEIQYVTKYQLIKKKKSGNAISMAPTGTSEGKSSNNAMCGGIFYCSTYTSGYTASDSSVVSESSSDGGGFWASFGGDGGEGGGCGGCGG